MRILVFSDTHGLIDSVVNTINRIDAVDMILHAGDVSSDAEDLSYIFPDIPVRYVCGNCEMSRVQPELIIDAEGKRIFLTHGHLHNVKYEAGYSTLVAKAKEQHADIAVFGHTHNPVCQNFGDFIILNPGSSRYGSTYGVIEIENGKIGAAVLDM
ncbi:MAG: metallophosphoesterase [Eubacteriales bacterium]|nr:metallophosphoesterase [Eubacteriales bacterium]